MANDYFRFKQFTVRQQLAAMKVTTDACLFGAWAAKEMQKHAGANSILDIGAGTGLLSLMIAQQVKVPVDAIEIDRDAFIQSQENFQASPWKERLHILHGDILSTELPSSYDLIISNPPFYENDLGSPDEKRNSAHHDRSLLLTGLIHVVKHYLKPGGSFYLLIPFRRLEEVQQMISRNELFISGICNVRQSVSHSFFRSMFVIQKEETDTTIEEISIRENGNDYTQAFQRLLKDYYLYL